MTKRRRSEEGWDELPSSLEVGNLLTGSTEGATVGQVWLEGFPAIISDEVAEGADQQLAVGDSTDVDVGNVVSLRGSAGVSTNPGPPAATEVVTTTELERVGQEPTPANRLREREVDVAGQNPADPNWFWELLEEAGWDVW